MRSGRGRHVLLESELLVDVDATRVEAHRADGMWFGGGRLDDEIAELGEVAGVAPEWCLATAELASDPLRRALWLATALPLLA